MRYHGDEPGHSMKLSLQLEDEYTHKIILQQKYHEKVEVVLAQSSRVKLFENRQIYHAMFIKVLCGQQPEAIII